MIRSSFRAVLGVVTRIAMDNRPHSRSADGYRVPQRLSVAEILAMLTVFGFLFGGLRGFQAPPVLYLFLGTQAVVVCLVQMRFGGVPRGASTLVGCVFLPTWVWVLVAIGSPHLPMPFDGAWEDLLLAIPFAVFFGGLLGYCTGAMVAGVFLVLDMAGELTRRTARRRARLP